MLSYRRRFNFIFLFFYCFFCAVSSRAETAGDARAAAASPDTFPAGAKNCRTAPLLCRNQLDGYTGILLSDTNTETDPNLYTKGVSCGNVQNNQWLAFLAGSDSLSLRVKVGNCNGDGLQIAILSSPDCVHFKKINCAFQLYAHSDSAIFSSIVDTTDISYLNYTNLKVGSKYYIMLDGYSGDVCDFKLNIDYGDILPVTSAPPVISGPSSVCANSAAALTFFAPAGVGALSYIWKVPAGASIIGPANGPTVSVQWGPAASGTVSAQAVGSCDTSLPAFKNVTVLPSLSGTASQTICPGESFNFNGKTYSAAGDYTAALTSAGGCDSVVTLHLKVLPSAQGTLDTVVCAGGCVSLHGKNFCAGQPSDTIILRKAAWTGCDSIIKIRLTEFAPAQGALDTAVCAGGCVSLHGKNFCAGQPVDTFILRKASRTGCDSVVRVSLSVLDLTVLASVSGALNCDVRQVTLDGSGSSAVPASALLSYEWSNPAGAVVGAGATQTAAAPGVYTLKASAVSKNVVCSKTAAVAVAQTGAAPAAPQLLSGARTPCRQSEIYRISSPAPNVFHVWTVPKGAVISAGAGTAAVTVNWTLGVNGDVCVSDSNSCGVGPVTCLSIRIREVSDSFPISGPATVCPDDVQTYSVANDTSIRQFKWLVSGGAIAGGDGSSKISIKWGFSGAGKIQVSPLNDCGTGKSASLTVLVKDSSLTPPAIIGPASVCAGQTATYGPSHLEAGRAYQWSLPDGGGQIVGTDSAAAAVSVKWAAAGTARVGLLVSNDCGIQAKIFMSVIVKDVSLGASAVTGASTVCPGASEKYAVAGAVNVSAYKWTISGGGGGAISGSDSSAVASVRWLAAGDAQVCADVQNDCQIHKKICETVHVVSDRLDSLPISGDATVCLGGASVYGVASGGNVSAYKWSAPAGGGQILGADTARTVNIRWPSASVGQVCLDAQNSCGVRQKTCLSVTVADTTFAAPAISGSMNVCTGKAEAYGAPSDPNIKTYKWTLPLGGGSFIGSDSSAAALIRWDAAGARQICLTAAGSCGGVKKICVNILAQESKLDSPVVSGSRTVCPGSTATYMTPSNPDAVSYHWTVPAGGRQIGAASNNISVAWDSAGAYPLCLQVTNSCGVVRQTCLTVAVKNTAAALAIAGDTLVCNTRTAIYSVPVSASATYTWKQPPGSSIIGPANSNIVIIKWGASPGGALCVTPAGGCSSGVESCISIVAKSAPAAPARINGPAQACVGALATYKADPVAGAAVYVWNYPGVTTETATPEAPVAWANPGVFSIGVQSKNECGVSAPASLSVEALKYPSASAGKTDSICGTSYPLKAAPSVGIGAWSLKSAPPNGAAQLSAPGQAACVATVSLPGAYVFQWKETSGPCSDSATVRIIFKEKPRLSLSKAYCAGDGASYVFEALANSAPPPFRVSGNAAGVFNGNTFVSAPLKSGFNYYTLITAANGCASDSLKGTKICSCATSAGTITASATRVCFGDSLQVSSNSDLRLAAGDTTEFILHDGTAGQLGAIIARNQTGRFGFLPALMSYDQTYHIALAAGKSVGGQVDMKAPCASVSSGVPAVFKAKTTARISGDTVVCKNGKARLLFTFSTPGLYNLVLQNGPNFYPVSNARDGLKTPVTLSGAYTLFSAADADGCAASTAGSATVAYRPTPPAFAGADQVSCISRATLAGTLPPQAQGRWYCDSAGVVIADPYSPVSAVRGLKNGIYPFVWRIQDSVCADQYSLDTVNIFIPITPPASDFAFVGEQNQPISGNVASFAPAGTYVVTRLNEPGVGRFSFFSSGYFSYIPEKDWNGIVTFKYKICSAVCGDACDTGKVKIKINPAVVVTPPVDTSANEIPTAITPNGDGKNDVWVVDHIDDFPENELLVFNRWGDVVYRSKPYKNNWGGTNQNGEPLPTGTYYYLLKLRIEDGKLLKGDITILR